MIVLAIDPGPKQSAYVFWDGGSVLRCSIEENCAVSHVAYEAWDYHRLAIEMVECHGMPVGSETFETCVWIGRFYERAFRQGILPQLIKRNEIKNHICHSSRAKDSNIRQALIDRFGAVGTKKNPGPLYGIKSHLWAALAVAVTAFDTQQNKQ